MILKEFCFEHFDLFEWREEDRKTYNVNSQFMRAMANAEKNCFTLIHEGRIMVIGGIIPMSEKTAHCFTVWSMFSDNHRISCARYVRRQFESMAKAEGYHRITTWNRAENKDYHKWCEFLGFKWEGLVRKFDDEGNDYFQYAWVKHGN